MLVCVSQSVVPARHAFHRQGCWIPGSSQGREVQRAQIQDTKGWLEMGRAEQTRARKSGKRGPGQARQSSDL